MASNLSSIHRINVLRLALTGAIASSVFFVFCWIGARISLGTLSHMYVQLFTKAEMTSTAALVEGVGWSIGFGLISGALIAWVYNILGALERS